MNSDEFLKEVCEDPVWLINCLSGTGGNLNPGDEVTFLVYVHAGILNVHNYSIHPYNMRDALKIWLEDMLKAGHPVCFNDLKFKDKTAKHKIFPGWINWFFGFYARKEAS